MVQRLASPSLIPTSQHAGNTTADNSAAMTAAGAPSQSAVPASDVAPVPQVATAGPEIPVPDTRQPSGMPGTGRAWKYTTASGKG